MALTQARAPIWSAAALNSGGTLTSAEIPVGLMATIGLAFRIVVAGTADASIKFAISADGGTTYGSYDNEIDASTNTTWTGLNPEDWHQYVIATTGATHIKIRVTELASLNSNVVDSYLVFTEDSNS